MNKEQKLIYNFAVVRFKGQTKPTHSEIVEFVKQIVNAGFYPSASESELNEIVQEYEINVGVKAFDPESIISESVDSKWFEDKKNDPKRKHSYWERYEDYLLTEKHFDFDTIEVLKRSTEEILGYCANPTPQLNETKKRRGLVVGDVQSGKTANYMALINMACDYDYKLIIILAGLTDSLRAQTQERVDEGFIGAVSNTIGSEKVKFTGVGETKRERYAVTLTNIDNDFRKESLSALNSTTSDYNKPVILVVKKNKSTLENVKQYLKPGVEGVVDQVLIIDDEADNASVNTKKIEESPSAINSLIRDLYNKFSIASYVGYTATPFANIFINPDDEDSYRDLFPSDFITLLKTPTSYFGANKVFGPDNNGETKYIREIDEDEENFLPVKHKKDDLFITLPESLKEAILVFFINNVVRTKRGAQYSHRTMMINISRFNKMQSNIKNVVSNYVNDLKNIIIQSSYMSKENFLRNEDMLKMYNIYATSSYYNEIRNEISWEEIQSHLSYEAERMKVIVVNRMKDEDKLDYKEYSETGARFIVIGGFVLSRGLTLEGLMISYYSRNGSAYDTLMQMCRWFGYRPRYEDLCRIYMSHINVECFGAVIDATNDLKEQFLEMKKRGKRPSDFGLMVKTCPDILNTLLVTSKNKSRNTMDKTLVLNYSCQPVDTSKIYLDKATNERNLAVIKKELEDQLGNLVETNGRFMYRRVSKDTIISLLEKIKIPYENTKFDTDSICTFLKESGRLNTWDVVFATGFDDKESAPFIFGGKKINPVKRSFEYRDGENFVRIAGNNNRLMDPGILNAGLDNETIEDIKISVGKGKTPSAKDYLTKRKYPILVIYPIDLLTNCIESKKRIKQAIGSNYLIGFAIGFPNSGDGISIKYKLNPIKIQELEREREESEDEDEE